MSNLEALCALCLGYFGCLRCDDLSKLCWEHLQWKDEGCWVSLFERKTGVVENTHRFLMPKAASEDICPVLITQMFKTASHMETGRIFRTIKHNKFRDTPKGIHKLRLIPKAIASFLELEHSEKYTGQCFRRSSATALADSGETRVNLKRHGGWKSDSVVEGYMHDSKKLRTDIALKLAEESSTAAVSAREPSNSSISSTATNAPVVYNFTNCSNLTLNFGGGSGTSFDRFDGQLPQLAQLDPLRLFPSVQPLSLPLLQPEQPLSGVILPQMPSICSDFLPGPLNIEH